MNKTVNINLSGTFFHIDEDAYLKLQHYLDAIKRSFTNTQGRDEIIADIEARIAELFNEKLKNERQVISIVEVQEVIDIMGQPEDYVVDEEIFEDEPAYESATTIKKLYRDTEHSYLGGVCSGLGHYLGIDPIWLRLIFVFATLFSTGAFILVYAAFWIFVPEARTTAEKLAMRGQAATIGNIERKIREGMDGVSEKMKGMDYQKYGNKIRTGSSSAATAIGDIISAILKVIVKLIGIFIVVVAGSTLISLFIGLFTVGTFGIIEAPWSDYIEMAVTGAPLWVISLLTFLAVGIPFFFLFILGLKILIGNLKTLNTTASLVVAGVWILAVVGLSFIGIQQATGRAFEGEVIITETLPVKPQDTLYLRMENNSTFSSRFYKEGGFELKQNENDEKVLFSSDITLIVRSTKDTVAKMQITKMADGKDPKEARDRAVGINYNTSFQKNELLLDSYFTSDMSHKYRDQKVQVVLYLPEGSVLFADKNTYYFHRNYHSANDILNNDDEEKYLIIMEGEAICANCPVKEYNEGDESWDSDYDFNANANEKNINITITKRDSSTNGKKIKSIRLDRNGVDIKNTSL